MLAISLKWETLKQKNKTKIDNKIPVIDTIQISEGETVVLMLVKYLIASIDFPQLRHCGWPDRI